MTSLNDLLINSRTLYLGDKINTIKLYETSTNENSIQLTAPSSLSSDITLTLPNSNGDSGQFLKTDGEGILSWDTIGDATNITISANNSTNETVYPLFVDGATGSQGAETDTGLTYNPSSGILTCNGFTGSLTGSASELIVSANNSTNETVYPLFVDGATGSQGAETDTGLTYNPSSGILTSTGFTGDLTGSASELTVSANNYTNETVYPLFVDGATGSQGAETDTGLTYNPSSGKLLSGNINERQTYIRSSGGWTNSVANSWSNFASSFDMEINGYFTYLLAADGFWKDTNWGQLRFRLRFVKGGTTYYFPRGDETESLTTYATETNAYHMNQYYTDYSRLDSFMMSYSNSIKIDPGTWTITLENYSSTTKVSWDSAYGQIRFNLF
jgi:hypothetical protein